MPVLRGARRAERRGVVGQRSGVAHRRVEVPREEIEARLQETSPQPVPPTERVLLVLEVARLVEEAGGRSGVVDQQPAGGQVQEAVRQGLGHRRVAQPLDGFLVEVVRLPEVPEVARDPAPKVARARDPNARRPSARSPTRAARGR